MDDDRVFDGTFDGAETLQARSTDRVHAGKIRGFFSKSLSTTQLVIIGVGVGILLQVVLFPLLFC